MPISDTERMELILDTAKKLGRWPMEYEIDLVIGEREKFAGVMHDVWQDNRRNVHEIRSMVPDKPVVRRPEGWKDPNEAEILRARARHQEARRIRGEI